MGNIFDILLIQPIVNILVCIYHGLSFLHIPSALGFSIILLTVLIRFVLSPLTASQLKASKKMQQLSPHISSLKAKHKNDSKKLQQETMRLYKEHGVNPASGCLLALVQLPLIWALYGVLQQIVSLHPKEVVAHINGLLYTKQLYLTHAWDQHFFGLPLGESPAKLLSTVGIAIVLFPLVTAALQFVQTKMMLPTPAPAALVKKKDIDKDKKTDAVEDFASTFQTQSLYIFPVMIGFLAYGFPIGLSLYWNSFTVFGIIQQYLLHGWGGLAKKG